MGGTIFFEIPKRHIGRLGIASYLGETRPSRKARMGTAADRILYGVALEHLGFFCIAMFFFCSIYDSTTEEGPRFGRLEILRRR